MVLLKTFVNNDSQVVITIPMQGHILLTNESYVLS
jgi:hypothetical protein